MERNALKSYPSLAPTDESALDPNSSYAHILQFVNGTLRVVDFGCGPGNLARFLAQRGCTVVGVDINPESAALAKEYCEDVLVADMDVTSILKLLPSDRFDVAIFADILEHLRDPWRVLNETHQILRAGGFVVASIPNIAHGAIRLSLLQGNFDYQEVGIMDNTHMRFFTHKTVESLFERAGFAIEETSRTWTPIFEPSELVPAVKKADFSADVIRNIETDPESETLQFVVKGVPVNSSAARYALLKRKNAALEARLEELETQLKEAQPNAESIFAIDREQWSEERQNLTVENATLSAERDSTQEQREKLTQEIATLSRERGQWAQVSEKLANDVDALIKERDLWTSHRSELENQVASFSAAREGWERRQLDLQSQIAVFEEERKRSSVHREKLTRELDSYQREWRSREAEAARVVREVKGLRCRLMLARDEIQHQQTLRDVVSDNNRMLAAQVASLRSSHLELEDSRNALSERETRLLAQIEADSMTFKWELAKVSEEKVRDGEALNKEIRRLLELESEFRGRILERQAAVELVTTERDRAVRGRIEEQASSRLQIDKVSARYVRDKEHLENEIKRLLTIEVQSRKQQAELEQEIEKLSAGALSDQNALRAEIERLLRVETELRERILERQEAVEVVMSERERILEKHQAAEAVLAEMRLSKFWRARNGWVAFKKSFTLKA